MTIRLIFRAMLLGIVVLVLAQVLYVGVLQKIPHHEIARSVLLFFPAFAALVSTYYAPSKKIFVGLSMTGYGVLIAMLASSIYRALGFNVDQIGSISETILILTGFYGAMSAFGTLIGVVLSRRSSTSAVN